MPSEHTSAPSVKTIQGHRLACRLRGMRPSWRVELAVNLIAGNVTLKNLTKKQACRITGAPLHQVNARQRQLAGKPLAELRHTHVVDRLIDRVIERGGLDRLVTRLDELTKPAMAAE